MRYQNPAACVEFMFVEEMYRRVPLGLRIETNVCNTVSRWLSTYRLAAQGSVVRLLKR